MHPRMRVLRSPFVRTHTPQCCGAITSVRDVLVLCSLARVQCFSREATEVLQGHRVAALQESVGMGELLPAHLVPHSAPSGLPHATVWGKGIKMEQSHKAKNYFPRSLQGSICKARVS